MCEFCLKHGEGRKWYLQAANYSEDLLSDLRRRQFIQTFFSDEDGTRSEIDRLAKLDKAPRLIKSVVRSIVTRRMKKVHFGQVLPIEDVEEIFGFVNSIVRVACFCRHVSLGQEKRYCYGISMGPNGGKLAEIFRGIDKSFMSGAGAAGVERLTKEEALKSFREHEREGLCHTVWTMHTPFIGGICNCDRADCLAMRCTVTHDVPVLFRAEYVAETDPGACNGCRQCMRVCQFGAITYSASNKKTAIDQVRCYGCGICRSVCPKNAIRLLDRTEVPAAAERW
jgi:Pyruvate/2-oxoacid:ferredoxin oxidoreductase delta subunit